jgi:hypothetical protein
VEVSNPHAHFAVEAELNQLDGSKPEEQGNSHDHSRTQEHHISD